jgi:Tfp pilus assembly PilM family ATPase
MALFGNKKEPESQSLLGVDIGTTGIKIVELAPEGGKIRLVTYGYADVPVGSDPSALSIDDTKKIAGIIQAIVKESGMKGKKAVASFGLWCFSCHRLRYMPKSAREDRPVIARPAS